MPFQALLLSQERDALSAKAGKEDVYELEGRLGTLTGNGLVNGVAKADFEMTVTNLTALMNTDITKIEDWDIEDETYTHQQTEIRKRMQQRVGTVGKRVEFVEKSRIGWIDCRVLQRKYDLRISLKCERSTAVLDSSKMILNGRRTQKRRSFWTRDGCRIDASVVQTQGMTTYEIEVEDAPNVVSPTSVMLNWLKRINSWVTIKPAVKDFAEGDVVFVRLIGPSLMAMSQTENTSQGTKSDTLVVCTTRDICRPK